VADIPWISLSLIELFEPYLESHQIESRLNPHMQAPLPIVWDVDANVVGVVEGMIMSMGLPMS
jgi:hypothetical protein